MIFLSHLLDSNTPTYGNRNQFYINKKSSIANGDIANDSYISTTVHIGTHIDMPYHFYENGQTIEDFDANFWIFKKVLFVEIEPNNIIIKDELISKLEQIEDDNYEILILKTGICHIRDKDEFWEKNYGFAPEIYSFIVDKFPHIRIFGFDSISVSSITNRMLGREAHKKFLNTTKPLLLLEDMDLRNIDKNTKIKQLVVSPIRIAKCDGLPCTVLGMLDD
ncbi:MAG: cyclase [Sulfurimonas sp.]|nr:MAG: cyclase [Sulfurimonas sp.]